MTDLIAANAVLQQKSVIVHLNDGGTITGEPYTLDVVGILIEAGPDSNFVPWGTVKRVYFQNSH